MTAKERLNADGVRHGTSGAWSTHGCRCEECRRWNRENQRRWRANHPDGAERGRAYVRAESKALRALAGLYPDDFERLFDVERALEGLPPVGVAKKGRRFGAKVLTPEHNDGSGCGSEVDQ